MTKGLSRLLASGAVLALVLGACSRPTGATAGKDPGAELLAHVDRMIAILRDNGDDPEKAMKELAAYQDKNAAELERLKQALAEVMQKDPMKAAAVSSLYGLRSAELAARTEEAAARARTKAP